MGIKKVELRDVTGENTLLPQTSLEMMDNRPLFINEGAIQIGDGERKFLFVDSSSSDIYFGTNNVTSLSNPRNLTINGKLNVSSKQNITVQGVPIANTEINCASMKKFPTMSAFGFIVPQKSVYPGKERWRYPWLFGFMRTYVRSNGEIKYEVYGYCQTYLDTNYLVPSKHWGLLEDVDPKGNYKFVPLWGVNYSSVPIPLN